MSIQNLVILILCTHASLDDLIYERTKHEAVAVDIIHYQKGTDYFKYREAQFDGASSKIDLMFVFGRNDSVIVKDEDDIKRVSERLKNGEC